MTVANFVSGSSEVSQDGTPGSLPCGWAWAKVGEIALEINPGFPSGKHNSEARGVPHLRPMNVNVQGEIDLGALKYVEADDYDFLRAGDVLFNNTNSPELVGKTACIRHDTTWAYSNHMTRIRLNGTCLEPAWVAYALHYLFTTGFFRGNCTNHVNQASINSTFLASRVILPIAPLLEQHRIVAKIEELLTKLDAGVAALKGAQANLKRYRASVLKAAVEGRLVPQDPSDEPASELLTRLLAERRAKWESGQVARMQARGLTPKDNGWTERYVEPAQPETSDLPELPKAWTWTAVGVPFDVTTGGTPSRAEAEYWDGRIPWVSSGEVANCRLRTTRECITKAGLMNSNAKLHPPGTVLLAMIGEGKTRGQAAVLETPAATNQNVAAILCNDTPFLPNYLFYCLMARYRENRGRGSGGMQPALNAERVRALLIPVCPVEEQKRIVTEVERLMSVCEAVENSVAQGLHRAERLRQSILKSAFEGKLVPQDPNDEPAEILLERIKREKAEHDATPRATQPRRSRRPDPSQLELI